MFLRTFSASALLGIAVASVITGCRPAEPTENASEKQVLPIAAESSKALEATPDATTSTPTETVQAPKTMSPEETVIKIVAETDNIETYADLEMVLSKYASKANLAEILGEIKANSESDREQMVAIMKSVLLSFKDITSIQENANGNSVTFSGSSEVGMHLILVLENNQWKIAGIKD